MVPHDDMPMRHVTVSFEVTLQIINGDLILNGRSTSCTSGPELTPLLWSIFSSSRVASGRGAGRRDNYPAPPFHPTRPEEVLQTGGRWEQCCPLLAPPPREVARRSGGFLPLCKGEERCCHDYYLVQRLACLCWISREGGSWSKLCVFCLQFVG